jgi:hypothetical protein
MSFGGTGEGDSDVNMHNADGTTGLQPEARSGTVNLSTEQKALLQTVADQSAQFQFTGGRLEVDAQLDASSINIGIVKLQDGATSTLGTIRSVGADNALVVVQDSQPLPIGAATEATLALIKAKTDNLDVALSTRASEATLALIKAKTDNLDVPLSTRATEATQLTLATEATLLQVKADTDNLDVPLSTRATEATLLLIKAKTDNLDVALSTRATESTLALIKAKTDNLDVALSTRATEATLSTRATEATLALIKVDTTNLDTPLSTRASESTLSLIKAKTDNLDVLLSSRASEATLALIRAKTDNLDVALSTRATEVTLAAIKAKTDNLDVLLSTLATEITLANLDAKFGPIGQQVMASSAPVVIASDQSAIPVSQNGTWNITNITGTISLPTGAATAAKQDTGNTSLASIDGKLTTSNTSLASIDSKLNSLGQNTMAGSVPVVIASDQAAIPVTITGDTIVVSENIDSWGGTPTTLGQKAMASSVPVVLASNQSAVTVTGTVTANIGTTNGLALDSTLAQLTIAQGTTLGTSTGPMVMGSVSAAAPIYTDGQINPLSLDTAGNLRVNVVSSIDSDTFSQGSTTSGQTGSLIMGAVTSVAPAYTTAKTNPLSLTTAGSLRTEMSSWIGSTAPTVGSKTSANSIPVVVASDQGAIPVSQSGTWTQMIEDSSGNPITATGGSLNVNITGGSGSIEEHTLDSAGDTYVAGTTKGTAIAARVVSSSPALTSGQFSDLTLSLAGRLYVDGSGVTQPVSGTVTANQGGTWTVQPGNTANTTAWLVTGTGGTFPAAQSGAWSTGRTWTLASGTDSVAAVQSGTWTVQQGGAPWSQNITQVGGSSISLGQATMAASVPVTIASDQTALPVSQSGTWNINNVSGTVSLPTGAATEATLAKLTIAQGASLGSNTQALVGGSVTTAAPTYTTGQISPLSLDTSGALRVNVTSSVDADALGQGSTTSGQTGSLIMGAVTTAAPVYTTAQTSPLSLTTAGALRVDGSAVTQPVSGTVTANQGGTWTVQPGNTANTTAWLVTGTGGTFPATQSGTWNINNVSGTVSLPTGASTAANQTTLGSQTTKINDGTNTAAVKAASTAAAATDPALVVAISPNNTVAATQSGTWNINNVSGTVSLPTGASTAANQTTIGNQTTKINDGTNTAAVKAASTAAVATDPALVVAISPNNSLTVATQTSGTSTLSNVSGSASSVTILAANTSRKMAMITNDSTNNNAVLYLKYGSAASTTSYTVQIPSGSYYELPLPIYTGILTGLWSTNTSATARVTELT